MASRENQTMQIFVIVLALVSLCLSVGLFMVNNSRKTAVAQAKNSKESENAARQTANEKNNEATEYKAWIGYPEADTLQTLTQTFEEDIKRWGSTFENPSFRTILENIFEENRKLAQSEGDAKAQAKELKQQLLAIETQKNQQIDEYKTKADTATQDKESLRIQFDKDRDRLNQEKSQLAAQLAEKREELDELSADHSTKQQELLDKVAKLDRVIEIQKTKIFDADPYAQPADGRIAWVNQRERKVWINIGESDQLRPQVTFSVYSGDANDVNVTESKGSIEVIRLLGTGMAEARITDDQSTRPLMQGDKVYSQVWNRGRQVGFAITGMIDLNDDGTDDIEQLKRIIQLNNGKVDAVPDDSGDIDGKMTVDTRYLILGAYPEDSRAVSAAARKAYDSMSEEADTLSIEVITLNDFLSLMGWRSEHRAVKVGKAGRSEDFPARPISDYKPRQLDSSKSLFRPRKPQPTY
ncbi:MAG: hypothetical protein AAGD11_15050 [Planctomycetota bacterium]